MTKYRAKPVTIDGIRFASQLEGGRYIQLRTMERAGLIEDLKLQVRYPLMVQGVKIGTYIADFVYLKDGARVIEDAKGKITPIFSRSAKHMAAQGDPVTIWPEKVAKRKARR